MDKFQIGPTGGNGGQPFDNYDIPEGARLTAIHVFTEWVINALQFDFVNSDGTSASRPPVGGLGGEHHVFYLDNDEYLTGISGRSGWYIDSIRFHTNKRVSPTFGGVGGERDFAFEAPAEFEVGGFFGRSAWYIDALGVNARRRVEDDIVDLSDDDEGESWLTLAGEGEALPASVVVRREVITSNEELGELEDSALMEAIAEMGVETDDEGTVDAAVYTQVIDDGSSGQTIAVILAVASEVGTVETVGDEPQEVAVMVTDAIESEEDISLLEEEAVEGAIDALLEEMDEETDEVEVTIYTGVDDREESGKAYAAVVAIATRLSSTAEIPSRSAEAVQVASTRRAPGKDLELVEGIGPKIAELLIASDIHDLAELAATPVEKIREVLIAGGRRFRLADPTTWPEQAALGAAGKWDKLTELQARLKAGR